jgi:hypothetical protein
MATLVSAGVDTSLAVSVDVPTPLAIIDTAAIEPSYSFYLAGTAHEALREHLPPDLPLRSSTDSSVSAHAA